MTTAPPVHLPLGISDFRKLRESGAVYVDKTDFITQVLATTKEVILVPRPRRFGKTLNLSTLRCFVEKSERDPSALFEGLAVWSSAAARAHFRGAGLRGARPPAESQGLCAGLPARRKARGGR